jgi:ATP adenylyltransferase
VSRGTDRGPAGDARSGAAANHVDHRDPAGRTPSDEGGPPPGARDDREQLDRMQRLWTPWRMSYVRRPQVEDPDCPFCRLPSRPEEEDPDTLILFRGPQAFVILNAYPYNPGHLMIVPYRHVAAYEDLETDELHEIADLTHRSVRALKASAGAPGFNIGWNIGGVAGAGIAEHLHQHVVPRWGGDTNFMPVVGQTRVLPQLLGETYERLRPQFAGTP